MTTLTGIAAHAQQQGKAAALLAGARKVGGIYHLDYDTAVITTDDDLKKNAGGVARHGMLLAAAVPDPDNPVLPEGEEVVLLRVSGVASLPHQNELVATRLARMQDMTYASDGPAGAIDVWTQAQIQQAAFSCRVLGTFYDTHIPGRGPFLDWGADLDDVYASTRYFVFVPSPDTLSLLASYPRLTEDEARKGEAPEMLRLGTVRFASTRRRARDAHTDAVPVDVRVTDFISRKTAVLGMTRAGKSNTNKTICTAIFGHAKATGTAIGQLIFDPQGEYAAVNRQDETALRLLSDDDVVIYRLGASDSPQVKALTVNFYAPSEIGMVHDLLRECLVDASGTGYVDAFLSSEFEDPNPQDYPNQGELSVARNKAVWGRFALYSTLMEAGYPPQQNWPGITVQLSKTLADALNNDAGRNVCAPTTAAGYQRFASLRDVHEAMELISLQCKRITNANGTPNAQAQGDPWEKFVKPGAFASTRVVFDRSAGTKALASLRTYTEFHSPSGQGDVTANVLVDLKAGKVVIVDLSHGSERVAQRMSERIVRKVLANGNANFRADRDPDKIQILVEEAHRLFDRRKADNDADPWVQLAKEAAKYEIGLMYATQEVTSIDPRILSATHNWVIAHLNSDRETRELAHYYDFADFAEDIRKAEDRGFVRMKTMSGKYIVPVQVAKFDHAMVNAARAKGGLPPVREPAGTLANGRGPSPVGTD